MGQPWDPNQPSGPWTAAGPPSPPMAGVVDSQLPPPDPWTAPAPSRPTVTVALPGAVVRQALAAGAAAVGAGLVVAYLAALVLAAVTSGSSSGELIGTPLPGAGHLGAWLFGLGVGAPLVLESGGSAAAFGAASASVTIHIAIPLVLAAVIGTAVAVTRRSQRRNPVTGWPGMLAAAGCAAVAPLVVGLLVAVVSRFSYSSAGLDGSASASIGVAVARGGLLPALGVFAVALVTRVVSAGEARPHGVRRQEVAAAVRAVVDYLVVTAALMTVALLVALLASGASAGAALGVSVLGLPVLGVVGTEMAAFAPLTASGSIGGGLSGGILPTGSGSVGGTTSLSLYGAAAPGWWALALLVPIVGIVVAGVRYARRRPAAAGAPWAAVGISALTLLVALFLLNLYAGVSISAGGQASSTVGSGSGGLSAGIAVGGLGYLSALVVGALLPLTGWLVTRARGSAAGPQHGEFGPPSPMPAPPAPVAAPDMPPPSPVSREVTWTAPAPGRAEVGVPVERPTSSGPVRPPAPAPAPPPRGPVADRRPATRPRTIALLAAVATLLTAGAAVAVVLAVRAGHTTVGEASAAATSATTEALPDSSSGEEGTKSSPALPSGTEPVYPTTSPGGIDLSAVATDPVTAQVAAVLDTYFGSINAHDGAGAASVFDPSGTVDPTDPAQVADFTEQISTTHDDQVVVHGISFDGAEYLVEVSFRSQQAAEYGPDGQTCTTWHLTYRFTPALKLIKAINATYSPC